MLENKPKHVSMEDRYKEKTKPHPLSEDEKLLKDHERRDGPAPGFIAAMQTVYGDFDHLPHHLRPKVTDPECRKLVLRDYQYWKPPPSSAGHRGRYLWTDAFAVLNFLTLYKEYSDEVYLLLAKHLIEAVHEILGRVRDDTKLKPPRLRNATDDMPLLGGLRIGKLSQEGPDADGQYFHYLTMWMFALNRTSIASGDKWYNNQAVSLAIAVFPHFVYNVTATRPRMYWKMSMDLSWPMVMSEGNLDPIQGYVIYKLLQETADKQDTSENKGGRGKVLEDEITLFHRILHAKWHSYASNDPLDLGLTLWTAHWFEGKEQWANGLTAKAICDLKLVEGSDYFDGPVLNRLAYRELGTCLGIATTSEVDAELLDLADKIRSTWGESGSIPGPNMTVAGRLMKSLPINSVMYATALFPGAFGKDYFSPQFIDQAAKEQERKAIEQEKKRVAEGQRKAKVMKDNELEMKRIKDELSAEDEQNTKEAPEHKLEARTRRLEALREEFNARYQILNDRGVLDGASPREEQEAMREKANKEGLTDLLEAGQKVAAESALMDSGVNESDVRPTSSKDTSVMDAGGKYKGNGASDTSISATTAGYTQASGNKQTYVAPKAKSSDSNPSQGKGTKGRKSKSNKKAHGKTYMKASTDTAPGLKECAASCSNITALSLNKEGRASSTAADDLDNRGAKSVAGVTSNVSDSIGRDRADTITEPGKERTAVDLFENKRLYKAPDIRFDGLAEDRGYEGASDTTSELVEIKSRASLAPGAEPLVFAHATMPTSPMPKGKGKERAD